MDRLRNSWQLVKASWAVLQSDKELLLFPVISGLVMIGVMIVFFLPLAAITGIAAALSGAREGTAGGEILGLVLLFVYYLISYTIVIFFNVALVGAAMIRLDGGDPTFSDGLRIARERLGIIVQYAAISATVGVVLSYIRDRGGFIGSILASFGGLAWNVLTFLVVPILAVKNVGPIDAIKESAALLKKTWGEQIIADVGIGTVFGLISMLVIFGGGFLVFALASAFSSIALGVIGVIVLVVILIVLGVIQGALSGVYRAALYRYAETGTAPDNFDIGMIRGAFKDKEKRKLF
jgi:hypothetical protein